MISLTSPVETRAHRWSAGGKLAGLAIATVVLFKLNSLIWLCAAFGLVLVLYALPGRVFLRTGLRRLVGLWPFVVLVGVWHVATGDAAQGAAICLRMITAVALANLVTMTTRLVDMMAVVEAMLAPLRWCGLRTDPVTLAIALVVRFTPVLAQKGEALTLAWRARGRGRPGWRIVLPFAVAAIDDAEHVAAALKARGGV